MAAELRLRVLGHQSGAEHLRPRGACGAPRGHPQGLVPRWEVAGRLVHRLAVVGPEEPRVGAAHVHVHRTRSLRCTGVWPSRARSARRLVAAAVRSRAWT